MKTDIFRKVSLERLSSPEQLDEILQVTSPKNWLALAALGLLLCAALVWGYEGSVATKAVGQGVIVRTGTIKNIVTSGSGVIVDLRAKVGDVIHTGQVIARVAQPSLLERIRITEEQLREAQDLRERARLLRADGARLQVEALDRQRQNLEREIKEQQDMAKIVGEQIPAEEQLLEKGLITKQQVLSTRQKLVTIGAQVETLRARIKQIDAEKFNASNQPVQSDADMMARVSDIERTLEGLRKELSTTSTVISPYDGEVLELKTYQGSAVPSGTPVASVQPKIDVLEMLAYLPASKAKDARVGQIVQVSPTTVKREEYGFMVGTVTFVAEYPATYAALMRNFENESLVKSLAADGAVTELRVQLEADRSTPTGFKWSSSMGPSIEISSGMICSVQIVTREQKPITLLFPMIKEKLGLS
ncbi:MAG: NHLP bacteriocin system secretion protein [Bryobacteraceae bacterium]